MSVVIDRLHQKLVSVLIKQDQADSRSEMKRGSSPNIYRMGLLLEAAQCAEADAKAAGGTAEAYLDAVTEHFNPSARIRTFLRKNIDPTVDADSRGWIVRGERR